MIILECTEPNYKEANCCFIFIIKLMILVVKIQPIPEIRVKKLSLCITTNVYYV